MLANESPRCSKQRWMKRSPSVVWVGVQTEWNHTSQELSSHDQPDSRTKRGSPDGRRFVLVAHGSLILTSNWKPLWRWGCWTERSGPLRVMTGVSVWVPFSPNANERQMDWVMAPRLFLHTCTIACTLPRLQGAHATGTRNRSIPDCKDWALLEESAEIKAIFYPSVFVGQVTTSEQQDNKDKNERIRHLFFIVAKAFLVLHTNSNANVWHITHYWIVKLCPAVRNRANY